MRILFLGGDPRQIIIINELSKNHNIDVVGYEKITLNDNINKILLKDLDVTLYDVIIFPVSGVQDNYLLKSSFSDEKLQLNQHFLDNVNKKTLIFTGIRTKCLDEMLELSNKEVISLMQDKEIQVENSVPTVEGIIADVIYNTPETLKNSNILILGYGNIGRLLSNKLKALDAVITVGVIERKDYEELLSRNINAFYTSNVVSFSEAVKQKQVIINTVPSLLLNKYYLDLVDKDIYILDVSSYPYGVDFEYAKSINLKCKLFLGIPSIVAPKTAGQILSRKINTMIGGEK